MWQRTGLLPHEWDNPPFAVGDSKYEGTTRHKFPSDHPDLLIRSQSIWSSILLEYMYVVVLTFFLYLKLVNSKRGQ
jgi:hypothetical protein